VLAVAAGALVASPAQAAEPPVLTSLRITPATVVAPGQVEVAYTADSNDAIVEAHATFVDSRNRLRWVTMTAGPSGSGVLNVGEASETDTWRVASINLRTGPDALTRICSIVWAPRTTGCTEVRDLTAYDVSVLGLAPEYDAPQLGSVTVSPASPHLVVPEQEVTVAWTLRAPASDLTYVGAAFMDQGTEESGPFLSTTDPAALGSGAFKQALPTNTPNGDYVLSTLTLCDRSRNCAEYHRDGSATLSGGALTPTGAQPTFAGSLRVHEDYDAPILTSLRLVARSMQIGSPVGVAYTVQDEQATLAEVRLRYVFQGDGLRDVDVRRVDTPRSGTISQVLGRIGRYRLDSVIVADGHTPAVAYLRDGTIRNLRFDTMVGSHQLDLTSLDIGVVPKAPKVTARAWPHGAKIVVGATLDSHDITGYEVVAEPGHHVTRISGLNVDTGLVTGLSAGTTYTVKVTAQSAAGPGPATTFTTTPLLTSPVIGVGDLTRDRRVDVVALLRDQAFAKGYWGNGRGGFSGGARSIMDTVPGSRIIPAGDMTGDGVPDLLSDNAGRLELYRGRNGGFFTEPSVAGTGWSGMRFITGGGDFSGDGRSDVLAVASTGQLYLYAGNGRGRLAPARVIGTGWQGMVAVFGTADFNGDRTRDVLAVDRAGVLWLYPGNGKGGLRGSRSKVGTGWAGLAAVGPLGDFTGDGKADVVGLSTAGTFLVYAGDGKGHVRAARVAGTGWQAYF
jgi:hypothetical protein